MRSASRLLLAAAALLAAAGGPGQASPAVQGAPADGPPADVPALLRQADEVDGLLALVARREGELVVEGYFDGAHRDRLLHLRSATKGVMSLLIGIALDRGLLQSIDQTLGELLGRRVAAFGDDKAPLTLRHLLTMTVGLRWNESADVEEYNRLHRAPTPVALYLKRPRVAAPGERWAYSSGASHVLSAVLSEVTGMSAAEFARRNLFAPLGIERFRWKSLADGHTNGAAGLQLRPIDTLKLGELMLHGGLWEGRRVVSAEWIESATRAHVATGGGAHYGFHWWVEAPQPLRAWLALGFAGQTLTVVPDLDIVVVTNCRWRGLDRPPRVQAAEVHRFLRESLAPLIAPRRGAAVD